MAEQSKSVEWVKIDQVHPNPENPREISEEAFNKLKKSIQEFPEMLTLRPLVVKEGVVLGGNMRLEALKQLGYSKAPIIDANELTDEQIKEFIIKDNVPFGKWDWDVLANDWDSAELNEWGLEVWDSDDVDLEEFFEDNETPKEEKEKITLEYTQEEHEQVIEAFNKLDGSKEKIVWELLGL